MHYCEAKVQHNYNCYNVYFNECLRKNSKFLNASPNMLFHYADVSLPVVLYTFVNLSLRLLRTTLTLENAIRALASIGVMCQL